MSQVSRRSLVSPGGWGILGEMCSLYRPMGGQCGECLQGGHRRTRKDAGADFPRQVKEPLFVGEEGDGLYQEEVPLSKN